MTVKAKNSTKATKAKRTRKPRRLLPEKLDYISLGETPNALDVVSGRGGGSNHHAGNKRYWERILSVRPRYKKLGKNDDDKKTAIAESIMDFITRSNGRFLQKEPKTARWFVLPSKIVMDKIKQALRDEYIPLFARGTSFESSTEPAAPAPAFNLDQVLKQSPKSSDSLRTLNMNSTSFESILKRPSLTGINISDTSFSSNDGLRAHLENLPSLNLNDFLKSCKSSESHLSNFLEAQGSFNRQFDGLSQSNDFPASDDLKLEIGKLPIFRNETSRGSLGMLTGHSLDAMASFGVSFGGSDLPSAFEGTSASAATNIFTAPKKPSWFAKFDEEVVSPSFQVHAV